jgi:hypothetical protein
MKTLLQAGLDGQVLLQAESDFLSDSIRACSPARGQTREGRWR